VKCCDITTGKLRTSAQLQRLTNTPDGGGGFTTSWATYATVRTWFRPLSGSERMRADRLEATTRNRVIMRYRADVRPADRVVAEGREYQIRAIIDLELRKKFIELDLDAGAAT